MRKLTLVLCLPLVLAATPAAAYIGPGLGAGAVAAVLGVLAAIFMAFVAVLWYPFKRIIRAVRGGGKKPAPPSKGGGSASA